MFFRRKERADERARQEAAIQAVKAELFSKIDRATEESIRANDLLRKRGDRAYLIYQAVGGERRDARRT